MSTPDLPPSDVLFRADDLLGDGRAWLELQDLLPHPSLGHSADMAVVNGARVSFLGESKGAQQDKKLLFYLLRHRHTSPFEQVEFKFRVRAPVVVWWQWVRHRTWQFNFQSGRYTPFDEDAVYIPQTWRSQSESNKQGSGLDLDPEASRTLTKSLSAHAHQGFALYQAALDQGVAREQARLFLPAWCSYYIAICKVDAWNLMHFLRLRMASDAQWEIRQFAVALHSVFALYMPWTAEAFDAYLLHEAEQ